jgi:hypothetical protein
MELVLVTPPAVEPVTLADIKLQCGYSPIEDTDPVRSDMLAQRLRRLGKVARKRCEDYCDRAFITQDWQWSLDRLPHAGFCGVSRTGFDAIDAALFPYVEMFRGVPALKLPKPKFQQIVSFTYLDTSGASQNMSDWGYRLDPGGDFGPAKLYPPEGKGWPATKPVPNAIQITVRTGYGDTPADQPPTVQQSILFLTQFYDENGAISDEKIPNIIWDLMNEDVNRG